MIFSSTPETNDDPEPLHLVNIDMRVPGTEDEVIESCERWLPRPEFDRAHQPNPILAAFREYVTRKDVVPSSVPEYYLFGIASFEVFGGFREWDRETHPFHSLTAATDEQVEHAKRVLTRLADFA